MSRVVTLTLNDREAKRVDLVKRYLNCKDDAAVVIILAACSKENVERALKIFPIKPTPRSQE